MSTLKVYLRNDVYAEIFSILHPVTLFFVTLFTARLKENLYTETFPTSHRMTLSGNDVP